MKVNKEIKKLLVMIAIAFFLFSCATNAPVVEYEEGVESDFVALAEEVEPEEEKK